MIIIVFLQSFSRFVIEADYFINIGYIVKNLCENKEKPKLHCNGRCYLAKQLKEQQKQEHSPFSKKDKPENILFFTQGERIPFNSDYSSRQVFVIQNDLRLISFPRFVFHPPAA